MENSFYFKGMANKNWRILSSADRMLQKIKETNHNILLSEKHKVFLCTIDFYFVGR